MRYLSARLPARLIALTTVLLCNAGITAIDAIATEGSQHAPQSAAQQTPDPVLIDPVLISQRRQRFLPRRFRPRLRPQLRLPQRTRRPQRRLIQARPRVRRRLPPSNRRLSWRVRPIAPAAYRWGGLARGTDCLDSNIAATELLPVPRRQGITVASSASESAAIASPTNASASTLEQDSGNPFDLTLQSHPTFWIHVDNRRATLMDFTVQNLAGTEQLYEAQFEAQAGTGLVGISLPESAPGLATGQAYVWQLRVECNPEDPSKDLYLSNEVQRIAASEVELDTELSQSAWENGLAQAGDRERPAFYAEAGLWQDAISVLANLRFIDPDNLGVQEDWEIMLEGLEMSQFKAAPVLQRF